MSIVHRGVEQLVARQAHNLEVIRSSRVSATKKQTNVWCCKGFVPYGTLFLLINPEPTGTKVGRNKLGIFVHSAAFFSKSKRVRLF